MIGNILDNTTELYMIKYTFGEIFSSGRATLYKNPSDQTVKCYTMALDRSYCYDVIFKLKFFGNISAGACFRF